MLKNKEPNTEPRGISIVIDVVVDQRFPTGGEFPPRGEFSISQGGKSSLPRFKKNYAQYETETILELMICHETYRTN